MPSKKRVLLIPNNSKWILAYMADQIQQAFSDRFEFVIIPETIFEARPHLWRSVLPQMDLVHCMNESSAAMIRAAMPNAPCPVMTWIHHVTKWSPDHEAAVQISSEIVACTEGWKTRISEFTSKPIHVVRHGIDAHHFRKVERAREKFGIKEQDFVVGFFGSKGSDRDHSRKGTDTFLSVARHCSSMIPNLKILLLGPGWDLAEFKQSGVDVIYPGFVPSEDLPLAYSALNAYLMTARVEGGPCTVLEAMACSTPVVATRVGLVPDVIVHRINGMTAEAGDVESLSAALAQLAADPELQKNISVHARQTAETLPWHKTLLPLAELYERVCGLPNSTALPTRYSSSEINKMAVAAENLVEIGYNLRGNPSPERVVTVCSRLRKLIAQSGFLTLFRAAKLITGIDSSI
jgi:glycosyltransferase involved in cell wall biosynthesis